MALRIPLVITFLLSMHLSATAQGIIKQQVDTAYSTFSFVPATVLVWHNGRDWAPVEYKKKWDNKWSPEKRIEYFKKLGNAFYFNADYVNANQVYSWLMRDINSTNTELDLEYYFRYALSLRSLGKYVESEKVFKIFNKRAEDMGVRQYDFKLHKEFLDNLSKISGRYEIKRADFNAPCEVESNYNCSDFAPTFYKEGLVFSSNRNAGLWKRYRHTWNTENFHDLHYIEDMESNDAVNLTGINTIFHESSSAISKDGKYIYFTRNNVTSVEKEKLEKDYKGYIRLELMRATWSDDDKTWVNPKELPFNNDSYSVAHPALSPDGKTLYFASDMPGTYGESDLYKVSIVNDTIYGKPKNLGSKINTPARETFPFISEDQILYFSSDWHPGLGGLDIFATSIEGENYKRPVINIGERVNSRYDDFSFIINAKTRKGYFASNRLTVIKSRKNNNKNQKKYYKIVDDIYSFKETEPLVYD